MRTGRRVPLWALFLVLVVMPLAELWTLIQVGQVIGAWWTIVLLLLMSVAGGWLIKREGSRAWRALTDNLSSGQLPTRELADGALILLGGALLLTPGFITDFFGLLLILPLTRPIARGLLTAAIGRKLVTTRLGGGLPSYDAHHPGPGPGGPVVRGDVVDP